MTDFAQYNDALDLEENLGEDGGVSSREDSAPVASGGDETGQPPDPGGVVVEAPPGDAASPQEEVSERRPRRARPPRFLGLDLAWAPRNSSGGAVMELTEEGHVRLVSTSSMRAHEDILGWVARNRGRGGCVLAVNAPLIVENTGGRRPCDVQLEQHFSACDAYHVNTTNASLPRTMGRALIRMGFDPHPAGEGDRIVETYNQPTQILLFDQDRPTRLKNGPVGSRKDAVARFRESLYDKLADAVPQLLDSPALDALVNADLPSSNGSRVGELEERLEAVLCAYTAAYLYVRGPESCAMLGDLDDGYVLIPMTRLPSE